MRRKHADLIIAWASGAEIQSRSRTSLSTVWYDDPCPSFDDAMGYRIKPDPKPDVVKYMVPKVTDDDILYQVPQEHLEGGLMRQLKITFDGETGKLKSAEVI